MRLFQAPRLLAQALGVVLRAQRLPEPDGARSGVAGRGPGLRLLLTGDSSAAGVGVATQREALSGQLVEGLSRHRRVEWQLVAKSGATAATTLRRLRRLDSAECDVAVLCIGVNDTKNGVRRSAWRRRCAELVDLLGDRHGARLILLSGLPPLERFPILPAPLSDVLGARAALFDADLRALTEGSDRVVHVPMDFDMGTAAMAVDGFHPGPAIYAQWAQQVGQQIEAALAAR